MKLQLFMVLQIVVTVEKGNLMLANFNYIVPNLINNLIGLGAVIGVDPPSGSVIADFEGAENVTTIMCNATDGRVPPIQLETRWSIDNFRGVAGLQTITNDFDTNLFVVSGDPDPVGPSGSFRNQLTILRLTSELDGVTIYCGIGAFPQQANFPLRVYRKFKINIKLTQAL